MATEDLENLVKENNDEISIENLKYGLCPYWDSCSSYLEGDYHCNNSRGIFLLKKDDSNYCLSCYNAKSKTD